MAEQDYFSQFSAAPVSARPAPVARPAAQEDPFAEFAVAPTPAAQPKSGVDPWLVGAGALGAGALALAAHNPAVAKAAGSGLMNLRKTSMLSGLAPLKSFLGNVGGSVYGSIERGSIAPLREMLSPATAREAVEVFKRGPNEAIAGPATGLSKLNLPGRIMGALDEAGQNALQRAGYSPQDAAREMLQAPVPESVGRAFDNPVMDFLVPFRKTPLNALVEGAATFKPGTTGQKVALGTALGTGAATGATAEDPKTIGIGAAASGRYGLPFAVGAGAARALTGGNQKQAIDVIDAVSDFGGMGRGVVSAAKDPSTILAVKPAAFSALQYLRSLLGIE